MQGIPCICATSVCASTHGSQHHCTDLCRSLVFYPGASDIFLISSPGLGLGIFKTLLAVLTRVEQTDHSRNVSSSANTPTLLFLHLLAVNLRAIVSSYTIDCWYDRRKLNINNEL